MRCGRGQRPRRIGRYYELLMKTEFETRFGQWLAAEEVKAGTETILGTEPGRNAAANR